ncbi:MAG: 50S ribosomal protein L29 [Acidobacteriota bacterium]
MKASELREQKVEELLEKEKELAEQLFVLRLHKVTGQLEKPSKVGQVKRDLARVLTVLREKRAEGGGQ